MRLFHSLLLVISLSLSSTFVGNAARADVTIDGTTAKGNITIESTEAAQKLRGISRVVGNLVIQNYDGVDLSALSSLTMVEGSLLVMTNAKLKSLTGLGSLERVYGILWIDSNPQLADLGGLAKLLSVEQALTITDNAALAKLLPACPRLGEPIKKIKGALTIRSNKSLPAAAVTEFAKKCTVGGLVDTKNNGS